MLTPQIGREFFGRIIVWRDASPEEFFRRAKQSLSGAGSELSDDEITVIFSSGLIQRDAWTKRYYRAKVF